nr:hypothetical protein [Gammaproteobacteria bacterium]
PVIYADPGGRTDASQSYLIFGHSGAWSATLELSSLNGTVGVIINGIAAGDHSGMSVASAGDVNADGIDDVIIGAYRADPGGRVDAGQSSLVFGHNGTWPASLELSSLNGTTGVTINGIAASDRSGRWVAAAGDVNGDGFVDVVIGAYYARMFAGQSYVVFGHNGTWPAHIELSSLNGTTGVIINGIAAGDLSGHTVASTGDVNGDGFDDIVIGAVFASPGGRYRAGQSYVIFGGAERFSNNQISIQSGEMIRLHTANLAVEPLIDHRNFNVTNVIHGRFALTTDPLAAITSFNQSQVNQGEIVFVHDGSSQAPEYTVSTESITRVFGGILSQIANITFLPFSFSPTNTPTTSPTAVPTVSPTGLPTAIPSVSPTAAPTEVPTTAAPTALPTHTPTSVPTFNPTVIPSVSPTAAPTVVPTTVAPTALPTRAPTSIPTFNPTAIPSVSPTAVPTVVPTTVAPTALPTHAPTSVPTFNPTAIPSVSPTAAPTEVPTTVAPTALPTGVPTSVPTFNPTAVPTLSPTAIPSVSPTAVPTVVPTTVAPTALPTHAPTSVPTLNPIAVPTLSPTAIPSVSPTGLPTGMPIPSPTAIPSVPPTAVPTTTPTDSPMSFFGNAPTADISNLQPENMGGSSEGFDMLPIVIGVAAGVLVLLALGIMYKRHLDRRSKQEAADVGSQSATFTNPTYERPGQVRVERDPTYDVYERPPAAVRLDGEGYLAVGDDGAGNGDGVAGAYDTVVDESGAVGGRSSYAALQESGMYAVPTTGDSAGDRSAVGSSTYQSLEI